MSVYSRLSFEVKSGSKADGAAIIQNYYKGATNQRFKLIKAQNGNYQIKAFHSNKCVEVHNASKADGAVVDQVSKIIYLLLVAM